MKDIEKLNDNHPLTRFIIDFDEAGISVGKLTGLLILLEQTGAITVNRPLDLLNLSAKAKELAASYDETSVVLACLSLCSELAAAGSEGG